MAKNILRVWIVMISSIAVFFSAICMQSNPGQQKRIRSKDVEKALQFSDCTGQSERGSWLAPVALTRRVHSSPSVSSLVKPPVLWADQDSGDSPASDLQLARTGSGERLLDVTSKERPGFFQRHKKKILVISGLVSLGVVGYSTWQVYSTCEKMEDTCDDCNDKLERALALVEFWQEKALALLNGTSRNIGDLYTRCTDALDMCDTAREMCERNEAGLLASLMPSWPAPQGAEQALLDLPDLPGGFYGR